GRGRLSVRAGPCGPRAACRRRAGRAARRPRTGSRRARLRTARYDPSRPCPRDRGGAAALPLAQRESLRPRRREPESRVDCAGYWLTSEPELLRDHHPLHLVGALADLEDLLVAVEPRDLQLVPEAVAAVNLERCVHHPVGEDPREELRLRGREAELLALVLAPRGGVDGRPP